MCRNIRKLFNFDPPATQDEVRDAALQFVRKISGATKPSKQNAEAFDHAINQITIAAEALLGSLTTTQPPRDRGLNAAKTRRHAADTKHEKAELLF